MPERPDPYRHGTALLLHTTPTREYVYMAKAKCPDGKVRFVHTIAGADLSQPTPCYHGFGDNQSKGHLVVEDAVVIFRPDTGPLAEAEDAKRAEALSALRTAPTRQPIPIPDLARITFTIIVSEPDREEATKEIRAFIEALDDRLEIPFVDCGLIADQIDPHQLPEMAQHLIAPLTRFPEYWAPSAED
jgi:hypothetical protein